MSFSPVFSAGTGNPSLFLLLSLPKAHIPSQKLLTPNTLNLPALKGGGGRMTGRRGRGGGVGLRIADVLPGVYPAFTLQ